MFTTITTSEVRPGGWILVRNPQGALQWLPPHAHEDQAAQLSPASFFDAAANVRQRRERRRRRLRNRVFAQGNAAAHLDAQMQLLSAQHPVIYAAAELLDGTHFWSLKKGLKKLGRNLKKGLSKVLPVAGKVLSFLPIPGAAAIGAVTSLAGGSLAASEARRKARKANRRAFTAAELQARSLRPEQEAGPVGQGASLVVEAQPLASVGTMGGEAITTYNAAPSEEAIEATEQFVETAESFGAEAALNELEQNHPQEAEALYEFEDASRCLDELEVSDHGGAYNGVVYDRFCGHVAPDFSGDLPTGEFYRSNLVRASIVRDLGRETYGQVTLRDMPYPILISGAHGSGRASVALAHELAHVANKLYKLGLTHGQVHDVGVYYATEGLPALLAMNERVNNG